MIACVPGLGTQPAVIRRESGASAAASRLSEQLGEFMQHYAAPRLEILVPEITSLIHAAVDREATPVSPDTATQALNFALLLPNSLPIPEISSDPDGDISFDWISKTGKMFSASIDRSGRIAYAGRFGERSKVHGVEQLSDSLPQEILRGIEKASE
jgi:hypothetical protein